MSYAVDPAESIDRFRRYGFWATLIVGLACFQGAFGAALQVLPLRVHLAADGAPEIVRVTNLTERPVLIQVETVGWADPDQLDEASRASEIIAVPPIVEIQGQDEQLIRLALRKPSADGTEQAYRLLITEVPRSASLDENVLALAIRLNLPLFVTPKGAKPDPAWSLRRGSGGSPELTLGNRGNAHLRVRGLKLFADGDAEPVVTVDEPAYVLAGQEKSWPLDLPAGAAGEMIVKAETNLGEVEATVALPGG